MLAAGLLLCVLVATDLPEESAPVAGASGDAPAREWARGFHGLAHFDALVAPGVGWTSDGYAGTFLTLRPRFGFESAGIRLAAGMDGTSGYELTVPDDSGGTRLGLSPVSLSLVAPDLLRHESSRFALTPALATTIPTGASHTLTLTTAQVRGDVTWRAVRAGLLATGRRRVLLASSQSDFDTCRGSAAECLFRGSIPYVWSAGVAALAKVDVGHGVSFGASAGFEKQWAFIEARDEIFLASIQVTTVTQGNRDFVRSRIYARWDFARSFGVVLSAVDAHPPKTPDGKAFSVPFFSGYQTVNYSLGIYMRTDEALNPEWLLP